MDFKKVVSIFALSMVVCFSAPRAVRAGGAPPTTTGATLRGSVRFEGKAPVAKAISMAADPTCAQQHPAPVMAQEVMVDAKGDLQNVIVFVSEGLGDRTFDAPSQSFVMDVQNVTYTTERWGSGGLSGLRK